ncbi:MAG: S8 family serine peptidase [Deltaproteobacteria bacterium]
MNKFLAALTAILLTVPGFLFSAESSADQALSGLGLNSGNLTHKEIPKISPRLGRMMGKLKDMGAERSDMRNLSAQDLSTPLVRVSNEGNIEVNIYCDETSGTNMEQLYSLGLETEVVSEKYKVVQGWLPYDKLEEAANLGFVSRITPPAYGHTRVGSVTTEGDGIMGSDIARDTFGVDGAGIKVGVISNGVDSMAASQLTGDLPDFIDIGDPGSGDEGTAMLEIVHDIAPGADLAFHNGTSRMKFIQAINFFRNNGVDVIVDDVGFLSEPYFQDGSVAEEAAEAVEDGIIFVSAAGNDADRHYQDIFLDDDPEDTELDFHDFGAAAGEGSDIGMTVEIPGFSDSVIVLQWTNPFGEASDDYDLFLVDSFTGEILDSSTDEQDGNDDPIEIVGVSNGGPGEGFFDILVRKFSGEDQTFEIFFNLSGSPTEYNVPENSIYGHPAAPGVIAVGATNDGEIEFFSAQGPSSIFFSPTVTVSGISSERAEPVLEQRQTPTIAAPNRISTTAPGFETFAGTSASAPHVAGVAALVLQGLGFGANIAALSRAESGLVAVRQVEEVRDILATTADDIPPPGFDNVSGFGSINAFAAVEEAIARSGGVPVDGGDPPPVDGQNNSDGGGGCSIQAAGNAGVSGTGVINSFILLIPILVFTVRFLRRTRNSQFDRRARQ